MQARRASNVNWANAFTMLRVALVPVFAWLLLWRRPPVPGFAALVFAVAAATDSLDGYVARRLDLVTGFGEFLDPLADKLLVVTALAALALDGRLPWWAFWVIVVREASVQFVLRGVLARRGRSLPAARLGKAKTVVQIAAVVLVTTVPRGSPVAVTAIGAAVVLTVVSGLRYLADAVRGRAGVPWDGAER